MHQSGIQLDLGMPVAMGCGERSHDGPIRNETKLI